MELFIVTILLNKSLNAGDPSHDYLINTKKEIAISADKIDDVLSIFRANGGIYKDETVKNIEATFNPAFINERPGPAEG